MTSVRKEANKYDIFEVKARILFKDSCRIMTKGLTKLVVGTDTLISQFIVWKTTVHPLSRIQNVSTILVLLTHI